MNALQPDLISAVREQLLAQGTPFPQWGETDGAFRTFQGAITAALVSLNLTGQLPDVPAASRELARRLTGLGVLQPLLDDPADLVQEIIVREGFVQVERAGAIQDAGNLAPDAEFGHIVSRTADRAGHQTSGSRPYVLADLPDGSRFTAIVPPLSVAGVAINVRRFPRRRLTLADLEGRSMFAPRAQSSDAVANVYPDFHGAVARYLAHVASQVSASLLISGEFSSGKSTLLGALASLVPETTQVAVVETFKEVQLSHPHPLRVVVPTDRGADFPSMDEVLNVVLTRMRPDLLILGEIVRDEAPRFLDAANLGKRAWSTIHAGSALGALERLETKALASGLPHQAVREQIAHSVNLVVHLARDGAERQLGELALVHGLDAHGNYNLEYLPVGRVADRAQLLRETWRFVSQERA
jgi:pilus assembly protein CpaF